MLGHAIKYLVTLKLSLIVLLFASAQAATLLWWDTNYQFRFNIDVSVGANTPDKGYTDYTARIATFDTATLISNNQMQADCDDLRILFFDGTSYQELERHVINCNSATTDIRFALAANITASSNDDNYYLYYGNAAAGAPTALSTTNVYLWYDDASIDRSADYVRGRVDAWHGTGWDNSIVHNAAGYYDYDTDDNFTSGYRREVDERDVYIEAEFFHTGCYRLNMSTGVLTRGIISSGALGTENSDHYYAGLRGQYPRQNGDGCINGLGSPNGYNWDGDIVKDRLNSTAVNGAGPADIVENQWRRQGLASWLVNPTNLSFYDEDATANWDALGFPNLGNRRANGTDAAGGDHEGRGFAAIMTAQDRARLRNVLIRRYTEPEPTLTLSLDLQSDLSITKSDSSATYVPGGTANYVITVTNSGPSPVVGAVIADDLPDGVTMTAAWTCAASSGSSSCNTTPSTTDPISINVDIAVSDSITVTIPVQFSSNMADY